MGLVYKSLIGIIGSTALAGLSAGIALSVSPSGVKVTDLPKQMENLKEQVSQKGFVQTLQSLLDENKATRELHLKSLFGQGPNAQNIGDQVDWTHTSTKNSAGETTVVIDGVPIDPREIDKINKMNVSDDLKAEIKRHYLSTGYMPEAQPSAEKNKTL